MDGGEDTKPISSDQQPPESGGSIKKKAEPVEKKDEKPAGASGSPAANKTLAASSTKPAFSLSTGLGSSGRGLPLKRQMKKLPVSLGTPRATPSLSKSILPAGRKLPTTTKQSSSPSLEEKAPSPPPSSAPPAKPAPPPPEPEPMEVDKEEQEEEKGDSDDTITEEATLPPSDEKNEMEWSAAEAAAESKPSDQELAVAHVTTAADQATEPPATLPPAVAPEPQVAPPPAQATSNEPQQQKEVVVASSEPSPMEIDVPDPPAVESSAAEPAVPSSATAVGPPSHAPLDTSTTPQQQLSLASESPSPQRPEPPNPPPPMGGMMNMQQGISPADQQQQRSASFEQPPPPSFGYEQQQQGVASPPAMRELRVEDALLYLDDVKREFKDQPTIYNKFLSIMKNFKSQEVDTPGVISQVSKLFRGYNNLILGFNTFLPDGNKISPADLERMEAEHAREAAAMEDRAPKSSAQQPPGEHMNYMRQPPNQQGGPHDAEARQQATEGSSPPGKRSSHPYAPDGPPPAQQGQQHQAVEFDHAISYVTTIKKRFANDPSTYHQFLEILHTYQKEQRGIKEVLEQVAHLFQDHPDLLKEFCFFLPDAVQEQAKTRLNQAAEESEIRIAAARRLREQEELGQYAKAKVQPQQEFEDLTTRGKAGFADDFNGRKRTKDGYQKEQLDQFVYNSAVERQFFDSARDALSSYPRDGGQAWAEFMKILDMYAQEVLTRGDMLALLEPLLGKRNDLFDELKRIIFAAGSPNSGAPTAMEDSWHSVPLAEIDFSRCRRCSPSYRALPRDYPAHPCSDRTEQDSTVLNDVWVSLPVGSEESYTFRHMRRNNYEESLFRVEDERFEIDMVIDSNLTTLQRLEPIAEEITMLSKEDCVPLDLGIKSQLEASGMGGKKFQYVFDRSILSVVHRNAITRIYGGDSGQEMLDLMVKNPTVAIPVVLDRLRLKNIQFQAVRERLNRQWKELAELNYHKSLDHRSLTWRTIDKRAISNRTLVAEIKDRAANNGKEGKYTLRQKLDKLKDEHGAFYEKTVGEKLTQNVDLTFFPRPDRRLFTPHLALVYDNVSWAQRDAYRILAFALERGPITPSDKERCHRLWVEFLGPWFDLSLNWMQQPAVRYQESAGTTVGGVSSRVATVVSEDDEESLEDEHDAKVMDAVEEATTDSRDKEFMDHHPLPAGAHVSTLYGEGKIVEFRRAEHIYAVQLRFGALGYLRPATVLCSMLPVEKSAYTRQLRADDRTKLLRPNDQLAFGTQSLYLFFRLHQILIARLNTAKRLAFSVGDDSSLQTMVEQMPSTNTKAVGRNRYEAYISLVYALLDGGVEAGKYEDRVRSLLGHGAYELATMDKLISHIWKDIQAMANDEAMWNLVKVYRRHTLAGSFQPEAFRQEAAYLSEGEPMYVFQQCPVVGSDQSVLYMEYVGVMEDEGDDESPMVEDEVEEPAAKRLKR